MLSFLPGVCAHGRRQPTHDGRESMGITKQSAILCLAAASATILLAIAVAPAAADDRVPTSLHMRPAAAARPAHGAWNPIRLGRRVAQLAADPSPSDPPPDAAPADASPADAAP